MPLHFLTDDDREILLDLIRDYRQRKRQGVTNPGVDEGHQTPECYVAIPTSANGIPALTRGVDSNPDEPGEGPCDIYKIVQGVTDPEIVTAGFDKSVYNVSPGVISQDWILVHKTKYGRWITEPTGGQASWIEFVVDVAGTGTGIGGFTKSDPSAAVRSVVYHNGGEPAVEVDTVYNVAARVNYIFEGAEDYHGIALYCKEEDKYYICQMECP